MLLYYLRIILSDMGKIIFKKMITKSEKKFTFIHIPSKYRKSMTNSINATANGKKFTINVNKVGRLVSSELFEHLNPKIGDMLILEKNSEKQYTMTVKQSHMRSRL